MIRRVLLATLLVTGAAWADTPPSVWERARDPAVGDAYDLHAHVQARMVRIDDIPPDAPKELREAECRGVLPMLERAGAEKSKSALLRYDLGRVYDCLSNYARSTEIYKAAIAEFPRDAIVDRLWLELAFACGHTGDHTCERNAYREVLRIETDELRRATPTLNLAETQMHLGDLKEAMEGYREAVRIAGRTSAGDTAPLATWGLAVALDRAGDRVAAEKEARFALEIERSMNRGVPLLRSRGVFFVPAWEIHWYEGLGASALARAAGSAREAFLFWTAAERSFSAYVTMAEGKDDRWLPLAKVRLAQIKTEREKAQKAGGKEPEPKRPARGDRGDVTL